MSKLGLGTSVTTGTFLESGFDLASISGLTLWLKKGTGITTDGGNVSSWSSSEGSLEMVQTDSDAQPVHNATTDAVQFTTARQMKLSTGLALSASGGVTVAAVITTNVDGTSTNTSFQTLLGLDNTVRIQFFAPGDYFYFTGASASKTVIAAGGAGAIMPNATKVLITWTAVGGTNGAVKVFKNTSTTSVTPSATATLGDININQIGNDGGVAGRGITSGLHELAIFNSALTGDDLTNALTDIATRNGIS
tara:strand:- start:268 stop:1017 length:750 start_codon:yes stop_codon:yes gene_type:complete